MILHCVFLKFRPEITAEHKAALYADIAALRFAISGMINVSAGANMSPEGLDRGYADGFVVTFEDAAARDRYLVDPAHKEVGGRIVAATEGGVDGVFVYDLQVV